MTETPPFDTAYNWTGPSGDPNDEQFGDIIETIPMDRASEFDAVMIGEPYDGAVIGRKGARGGPRAIRDELATVKTHHFDGGAAHSVADLGSVDIPMDSSVSSVQDTLAEITRDIHELDTTPIFLGGDNSLTYPNVLPLLEAKSSQNQTLGVVNIDAHLDCREVQDQPSSGTPYRQLCEAGLANLVTIGARHFETTSTYVDYFDGVGGELITAEPVGADPESAADRARNSLAGADSMYVSVDIDVLDTTAAPGVSAPTPGGLSSRELFTLVRDLLKTPAVAGFELVETAPPLCPDGRTAATAARVLAHALSGLQSPDSTIGGGEFND